MATTTATQIQQLYVGLLGRAADQGGLNWWADQVTTGGKTLEDVRASFVTSTEYTTTYGAAATRADLVTSIYQNLFERTPSADEVKYWAETDTRPADQLVAAFIEFAGAADQAVINNKTFVAQTYTDTVGTGFSAEGAAAVIANVDGTSASVAAAIKALNDGSLAGQVPGVGLINDLSAAQAAQDSFETANKAAVDALAEKLDVTYAPADDTFAEQLLAVKTAADAARVEAGKTGGTGTSEASTSVLEIRVSDAQKAVEAQRALVTDKTAAATYEAALAKDASVKAADANDVLAAKAGLDAVDGVTGEGGILAGLATDAGLVKDGTPPVFANSDALYKYYISATTSIDQRGIIDAAFADEDVTFYATFKATALVDVADKKAAADLVAATGKTTTNFENAVKAVVAASATYEAAKLADADKAAADALTSSHDAAELAVSQAGTALDTYNSTHTDTKVVKLASVAASADVKEAFYFGEKATATDDFTIGNTSVSSQFGAGDAIVLGNGYTFNNGDLSTGNNNALEFFFVKTATGTQVVVETANYGSSDITANATTGVAASPSDHLAVITLTGVTAEHLSVANGVISYV